MHKVTSPYFDVNIHVNFRVYRVISPEDGKKLADSWKAAFLEASAKENQVS